MAKCYHCGKDLCDTWIMENGARIMGKRSRRSLTRNQATAMASQRWAKTKKKEE